ncbi:Ankyrin repeat-containing domain [Sesbania bispinosa]|nr:Ankyrin repeat-containing domain [Sesbania bispinosa]
MAQKTYKFKTKEGIPAFGNAAFKGYADFLQLMIEKNENLPIIPCYDGALPVHFAALGCHKEVVKVLSSKDLIQK